MDLALSPLDFGTEVWTLRFSGMEATISGSRAPDMVELSVDRKKSSLTSVPFPSILGL